MFTKKGKYVYAFGDYGIMAIEAYRMKLYFTQYNVPARYTLALRNVSRETYHVNINETTWAKNRMALYGKLGKV